MKFCFCAIWICLCGVAAATGILDSTGILLCEDARFKTVGMPMEYAKVWGNVKVTKGCDFIPKELWVDKNRISAFEERREAEWKSWGYVAREGTIHPKHSFVKWTQQSKYWDRHRDWFGLTPNGVRGVVMPGFPSWISKSSKMCVSNEEIVDERIAEWVRAGKPQCLACGENDGYVGYCRCVKCRALDADRLGEPFMATKTDRYLNFWNRVAAKASKLRSDVKVAVHLYGRYYEPPRREKVEYPDNIRFSFVAKYQDENPVATIAGWKRAGLREFFLRPNYLCNRSVFPIGREKFIWRVHRDMLEAGSLGDYFDTTLGVPATEFETYVAVRLCADPWAKFEDLEKDWCDRFGAAAPTVKAYFTRVRARCDREWPRMLAFFKSENIEFLDDSQFSCYYHKLHTVAELEEDERFLSDYDVSLLTGESKRRFEALKLCARHYVLTRRAISSGSVEDRQALLDYRIAHGFVLSQNWLAHYTKGEFLLWDCTPMRVCRALTGISRFVDILESEALDVKDEKAYISSCECLTAKFLKESKVGEYVFEKMPLTCRYPNFRMSQHD